MEHAKPGYVSSIFKHRDSKIRWVVVEGAAIISSTALSSRESALRNFLLISPPRFVSWSILRVPVWLLIVSLPSSGTRLGP